MTHSVSTPRVMNLTAEKFLFSFEADFNYFDYQRYWKDRWHTGLYWCVAYLIVIFGVRELMKNRKPFDLRKALVVWNIALSMFSIIGATRSWPEMIQIYNKHGFWSTICQVRVAFLRRPERRSKIR